MKVYLIRHGHMQDLSQVADPFSRELTPRGQEEARKLADLCREWEIEFLCVSTMLPAQQTADAIHDVLPDVLRWDLQDLEDTTSDDLIGEPNVNPLRSAWTEEQQRLGFERTWIRVMATLARILLYAQTHQFERIALLTHTDIINLLLLHWLDLDWQARERVEFTLAPGATCRISLPEDGRVHIDWVNR